MRAPVIAPASYAPALSCWVQMMKNEMDDAPVMQKEWKADPTDAAKCCVLVVEAGDSAGDVIGKLLRLGFLTVDLPNATTAQDVAA